MKIKENRFFTTKVFVSIFACLFLIYCGITLTTTLRSNAATAELSTNFSLAQMSEAATLYLNRAVAPSGTGLDMKETSDGAGIWSGTNINANAGGVLGHVNYDTEESSFWLSSHSSKAFIKYSYSVLKNLPLLKDPDTQEITGTTNAVLDYARYGYALSQLGFDETAPSGGHNGSRMIIGMLLMGMYLLSLGTNAFFQLILTILNLANPYRLFDGIKSFYHSDVQTLWTNNNFINGQTGNAAENSIVSGIATLSGHVSHAYELVYNFAMNFALPLWLALMFAGVLLFRKPKEGISGNTWIKIKRFAVRCLFLGLGVPLMFACYNETLRLMKASVSVSNSAGTKLVASTFLDFDAWVSKTRLGLPSVSNGKYSVTIRLAGATNSTENAAGTLDQTTVANTRRFCYMLNDANGVIADLPDASSIFGGIPKGVYVPDSVREAVATKNTADELKNFNKSLRQSNDDTDLVDSAQQIQDTLSLLQRYARGEQITAATFEGKVKVSDGPLSSDLLGANQLFADSASWTSFNPELTKHYGQMASPGTNDDNNDNTTEEASTEESSTEETTTEEATTEAPTTETPNGETEEEFLDNVSKRFREPTAWAKEPTDGGTKASINIWADGTLGMFENTDNDGITFYGGYGESAVQTKGLSTMSMYNYLNTKFDTSEVTVFSPTASLSDNTKEQHYSVVMVGQGFNRLIYLGNMLALMCCISVLGYCYGFALVMANFRAMFKLIPSVIRGTFGSMGGIASSIALTCSLIAEVIVTIFAFDISQDLIMAISEVIESPFVTLLSDTGIVKNVTNGVGETLLSLLSPVLGLASVAFTVMLTKYLMKWRTALVRSMSEFCVSGVNSLLGTKEVAPNLDAGGSNTVEKLKNAAGIGAGLAMAGAAGSGLNGVKEVGSAMGVNTTGADGTATKTGDNFGVKTSDNAGSDNSSAEQKTPEQKGNSSNDYSNNNQRTNASSDTYVDGSSSSDSKVGDSTTANDSYNGDTFADGNNVSADENGDKLMTSDTYDGDTSNKNAATGNVYQDAKNYLDQNANFLDEIGHSNNIDVQQMSDTQNQNSVNADNASKQVQAVNNKDFYEQGVNATELMKNAGDLVTANTVEGQANAVNKMKETVSNMSDTHDFNSTLRDNAKNGTLTSEMLNTSTVSKYDEKDSDSKKGSSGSSDRSLHGTTSSIVGKDSSTRPGDKRDSSVRNSRNGFTDRNGRNQRPNNKNVGVSKLESASDSRRSENKDGSKSRREIDSSNRHTTAHSVPVTGQKDAGSKSSMNSSRDVSHGRSSSSQRNVVMGNRTTSPNGRSVDRPKTGRTTFMSGPSGTINKDGRNMPSNGGHGKNA